MALLSITLFHVVLRDAQFASAAPSPAETFDALLVGSTIFDNRSLAILSFFLLFTRRGEAPYGSIVVERARRLLLPYLAWTTIYPLLDLGLATLRGESLAYVAQISSARFWLSGYFLAATTEHLHFLPTLFVLTLIFPLYKTNLRLAIAIALPAATSVVRAAAEFFIIGDVYAPTLRDLILLTCVRVFEYLPLGVFAFVLAKSADKRPDAIRWKMMLASIILLVIASILLKPVHFAPVLGNMPARLTWLFLQAVLGTVIMCLAVHLTLAMGGAIFRRSTADRLGALLSQRALGIFLLHPFFIDTFDTIVGPPEAYTLSMVAPKLLFAFVASWLAASILVHTRGLRAIV